MVRIDAPVARARPPAALDRQRLPAALVHCWLREPLSWSTLTEHPDVRSLLSSPGVVLVRDGVLAVVPSPGSAEIFDTAARTARGLLRAARWRAKVLIVPGHREAEAGAARGWSDALEEALAVRPPDLRWNGVYVTGYAAYRLEGRFQQLPRGVYQSPAGHQIPLLRLGGVRSWEDPRRNVQPLGRSGKAVPRPLATKALEEHWQEPILRVEGLLGAGKSRLIWEVLQASREEHVWSVCAQETAGGAHTLAEQLFAGLLARSRATAGEPRAKRPPSLARRELLEDPLFLALRIVDAGATIRRSTGEPLRLVIDAVENATAHDRELIGALAGLPQVGDAVRLLLIGRSGTTWPAEVENAPSVRVPLLGLAEADALGRQLIRGLSLPDEVLHRFVQATGGNPLALEEGLHALIHRGGLRRIYGSFFFSGNSATGYEPSDRWICQVIAEAGRIGEPSALLGLVAAACALPAEQARAASREALPAAPEAPPDWYQPYLAAQWLQDADTPWGPGYEFTCPALLSALRWTLPEADLALLRQAAGRRLARRQAEGAAGWHAYGLLRGAPEAIPALLGAARAPSELESVESLLAALRAESARAEPEVRLDLLWELLPLAHQHGQLEAYAPELEQAIALAVDEPKKLLAFGALRAELQESQGRYADAEGSLRQALETAIARTGNAERKALLSIRLGRVLVRDERYDEARRLFEEIQPLLDRAQRTTLAATCDFYLGNIALHEGRLEDARAYHEVALKTRRDKGQRSAVGASLAALGATALAQGFYAEALGHFGSARRTLGDAGDPSFELLGEGRALDRMGDFASASARLRQALALRTGKADSAGEAVVRLALAENQLNLDHADVARRELLQAHFLLTMRSPSRTLAEVEALLGRLSIRQKTYADAGGHFRAALDIHRARQDRAGIIMDLAGSLDVARSLDDAASGAEFLAELQQTLDMSAYPERGEIADLALFRGVGWLRLKGIADIPDPLPFLQRGYENLVRKMARLSPESRNRYLLQVTANREILQASTQHGIAAST